MTTPGRVMVTVALLAEIINGGRAFLMPVGFTSLQHPRTHKQNPRETQGPVDAHSDRDGFHRARKPLFAAQYFDNDNQWDEDVDEDEDVAHQQQQLQLQLLDNLIPRLFGRQPEKQEGFPNNRATMLGGAALGTMMAINNAMGMSVGAEPEVALSSQVPQQKQSLTQSYSEVTNADTAQQGVTLPYLEKQIHDAEEALRQSASTHAYDADAYEYEYESATPVAAANVDVAAPETTATVAKIADAQSEAETALPYLEQQIKTAEESDSQSTSAYESSASVAANVDVAAPETTATVAKIADAQSEAETALPYLEQQIKTAEESDSQSTSAYESSASVAASVDVAAPETTATVAKTLDAQPKTTLPYLEQQIKTVEESASQIPSAPGSSASVVASVDVVAPKVTATVAKSANTQPEAALPYLEQQIKTVEVSASQTPSAYKSSAPVVASVDTAAPKVTATVTVAENNAPSPSFVRYTKEHIPGWIKTGQKVYDTTAPKVVAGGQKVAAEFDRRVTPKIIEKEHELLGYANSAVLDETLSNVADAGNMVAGMVGKAISLGIKGGVQVAKATPEVVATGKQMYNTMDQKIVPEVVDTTRKVKMIVDKTVPEVVDAGKHAYDTIMPEVKNAEKQVASTVKSGIDLATPAVKGIGEKAVPVLSSIERNLLGDEEAYRLEKTIADAAYQGRSAFKNIDKTIPEISASLQKTAGNVAHTGRTVSRVVPVIVESGKQAYESVDRSISGAVLTTRDIASDIDRAAGKTVYAIEDNMFYATRTIDKAIPVVLETGRWVTETGIVIAKTVERGGRAVIEDVSEYVDDVRVEKTIDSATKRFARTQPTYQDFTAFVNDPNNLGKL
eukprot:CAMPEP_0168310500 /NCGR_PEP_ID=MMETSP0142_2-20121227/66862_1 /TAXON_ID=44445 /ORGANISM="Pseudo-nitzschia australis, Strain 10249 10 AB" /LENGTH=850 /DNA_ID=CAMNT_0008263327 /DNA_START=168 /DNA_END=2720 /DNA_ORIENTATION=-